MRRTALLLALASTLAAATTGVAPGAMEAPPPSGVVPAPLQEPPEDCDKVGTAGDDLIRGNDRDQVLCGRGGNDTLLGRDGNDVLRGGSGDDTIRGGDGDDDLRGGKGEDLCRQHQGRGPWIECEWPNPLKACPVPGGYLTDSFGDPRPGGRTHQGIDIMADRGTPIHAAIGGMLDFDRNELGGKTAYVDNRLGFIYNAHLNKYEGEDERRVKAGDVIGYVGTTGNAQGGAPHLHFEWHPNDGDAVDPYRYVRRVCNEEGNESAPVPPAPVSEVLGI